jgi:hypothetical protein
MKLSSISPQNDTLQLAVVKAFRSIASDGSTKQKIFDEGGIHVREVAFLPDNCSY